VIGPRVLARKLPCTAAAALLLLSAPIRADAHRLDEYLQAATLEVETDRMQLHLRLVPGVLVWRSIQPTIDTNRDGAVSRAELRAYAERFRRDLSLRVDGEQLTLRLLEWHAADAMALEEGLGTIEIRFAADVPRRSGPRTLVFENRHAPALAAYLVNALVPQDPAVRIKSQHRNERQSRYRLDYEQRAQ
jgi:hypothetical protein